MYHGIFAVLFLLAGCLRPDDRQALRKLCVLFACAAAAVGIFAYCVRAAMYGGAGRMGEPIGNPNATGIFLVIGWLAMQDGSPGGQYGKARRLEPVLLAGAAMTLSMGSFLSMAVGVCVLAAGLLRTQTPRRAARHVAVLLAKAVLGMGTGLCAYLLASRTAVPWACAFAALFALALSACWDDICALLEEKPAVPAVLACAGACVAITVVIVRPSATATFAERIEMMAAGMRYLGSDPVFGIGPFQWRLFDMHDGGKYFNTWHIHNALLHTGVESGLPAMAALAALAVRAVAKRRPASDRAVAAAFVVHNMIDVSFFYVGITAFVLAVGTGFRNGDKKIGAGPTKALFLLFAAMFAYSLLRIFMIG